MDIGHELHLNKYKSNCIEMSQQYMICVKHNIINIPHIYVCILVYCSIKSNNVL